MCGEGIKLVITMVANDSKDIPILNKCGYRPVVGTVTGVARIVYGAVRAIFAGLIALGALMINGFDSSSKSWGQRCGDGLLHIGRGLVELTPFLGGGLTYLYDRRLHNIEQI
jgi:hypothetical protein